MPNVKITNLPAGVTLTGTEPLETVQAGVSVQVPASYFALPSYPYITAVNFSATLPLARVLTAGTGIAITDGGAGTTLTVSMTGAAIPSTVQGDMLYASATNVLSALAKNTTATRYLSNTGANNNPAWAQVDLSNGVTGNLPVGNLSSGSGASTSTYWRGDGSWSELLIDGLDVGYIDVPQHIAEGDITFDLVDRGKHVIADGSVAITEWIIPLDSTVAFPIGACITLINDQAGPINIITEVGVTLTQAGTGVVVSLTLNQYGMATILKIDTDSWYINGVGFA